MMKPKELKVGELITIAIDPRGVVNEEHIDFAWVTEITDTSVWVKWGAHRILTEFKIRDVAPLLTEDTTEKGEALELWINLDDYASYLNMGAVHPSSLY